VSVHFEVLSRVFRCYAEGESYEAGDEPIATGVVNRRDCGEVEIMATLGTLHRHDLRDLIAGLGDAGVTVIRIKRRKGHRVPLGRLVESTELFDIYELSPADVGARP